MCVPGCEREASSKRSDRGLSLRNVLLITIDTLRADRLGCYGHTAARTPTIDALAASGVRFENAFTHVPLTLPSHATLLTGRYPSATGIRINGATALNPDLPMLPHLCKQPNGRTGAFIAATVLESGFGLARGFDHYDDRLQAAAGTTADPDHVERPADQVADAALAWLNQQPDIPFLAWVHFYDPHAPYAPPAAFREATPDAYDGEIAFVDSQIRRILDWLDGKGLRDKTLIVMVGDHGESLDEHGEAQHGLFIYDCTMHVPFILSYPAVVPADKVVTTGVGLVDVLPTVLELIGRSPPAQLDGHSLVPLWHGGEVDSWIVYGESEYPRLGFAWSPLRSLIDRRWRFIEAPIAELYDRVSDPKEQNNVLETNPEVAATMRKELAGRVADMEQRIGPSAPVDSGQLNRLMSLGYVGQAAPTSEPAGGLRRDPKDMIAVYRVFMAALGKLQQRDFPAVANLLEPLASQSPESAEILGCLGTAYLQLQRYAEAQHAFEAAVRNGTDNPRSNTGLAEALRSQGKPSVAIPFYEKALAASSTWEPAHRGIASVYSQLGKYELALPHWQRCLELVPDDVNVLTNLGSNLLALGKPRDAVPHLRKAVGADPRNEFAYRSLWQALAGSGQRGEAITSLRAARAALPDNAAFTAPLAWLLATTPNISRKDRDEARRLAQQCSAVDPQNVRCLDTLAAAYAALDDFASASEHARRASALASARGETKLQQQIEMRLQLYLQGKRYEE